MRHQVILPDQEGLNTTLTVRHHRIVYEGNWSSCASIFGVVTRSDKRRCGSVRTALERLFDRMHEEETIFSALIPFHVGFYRKFGYENVYQASNLRVPVTVFFM